MADNEIIELLRGDSSERAEAIRAINNRYKRYIWGTIRKVAQHLDTADLEDIYQEVFLAIIKKSDDGNFPPDLAIMPYIGGIAHNITVSWLRKIARQDDFQNQLKNKTESLEITVNIELPQTIEDIESENELALQNIREIVSTMPCKQKQIGTIIVDHLPKRLSNREIAEIVADSYGEERTEQAIKRSRQEMQKKLQRTLRQQKREVTNNVRS